MLVLKAGMRPSAAIDALFADPGKWRVECAEFVQVAQLYALRHAQGATAFDQKQSGMSFVIKPHRSSGIVSKQNYSRTAPGTKMVRETDSQEEPKDVEQLLKEAPFGSRVMWSNLQGSGSALNENAIKLGDDEFAAHLPNAKKNTFTRAELELLVAGMTAPQPDAAYVKANIFIAQIQHYDTP